MAAYKPLFTAVCIVVEGRAQVLLITLTRTPLCHDSVNHHAQDEDPETEATQ